MRTRHAQASRPHRPKVRSTAIKPPLIRELLFRASLFLSFSLIGLLAILFGLPRTGLREPIIQLTVLTTVWALRALGIAAHTNGADIISTLSHVTIILECTPVFICNIYISAILAYPSSVKAKLLGVSAGVPALFLINTIRVVSLVYVSRYFPQHLDAVHYLAWQALLVFFIASFWIYWCSFVAHTRNAT